MSNAVQYSFEKFAFERHIGYIIVSIWKYKVYESTNKLVQKLSIIHDFIVCRCLSTIDLAQFVWSFLRLECMKRELEGFQIKVVKCYYTYKEPSKMYISATISNNMIWKAQKRIINIFPLKTFNDQYLLLISVVKKVQWDNNEIYRFI